MNDLSILLSAKLDQKTSETDILTKINNIKKKIGDIKIKIDIDDSKFKVVQNFTKSMEKIKQIVDEQNKAFKEEIEIIKKADGTIEKKILSFKKNGEIIQRVIKDRTKATEETTRATEKEKKEQEYVNTQLKERIKLVKNLNAEGKEVSRATTYREKPGYTTTVAQKGKEIVGVKEVINDEAFKKAGQQLDAFKNKYINYLNTLKRSKLGGFIDDRDTKKLHDYIKNVETLDIKTKNYVQSQYNTIKTNAQEKNKIWQQEKNYEQWWLKALKERDVQEQKRIEKLGTQIGTYKDLKGEQITHENLAKRLSSIYKNQQVTVTDLNTVTGKYTALIRESGKENTVLKGTLDSTTGALYRTSGGTKEIATATKGFVEQLKIALVRVPVWMLAMTAFWGSVRSFQSGLKYLYEIDTELTNLKKVAEGTTETFKTFGLEANKIAHRLGTTTKEVIVSATEFSRLGYNLQQAKVLAQEAILYANVGDMEAEQASQSLISTIKGFGIAVDEQGKNIRKVVDIFNEVGKKLLPPILVIV